MASAEDAAAVAARRCTIVCDHWKLHVGTVGENHRNAKDYAKVEDYLEPLQSVGEMTERVLCPFGDDDCGFVKTKRWGSYLGEEMTIGEIIGEVICPFDNGHFIVEASCGPRYCQSEVDKEKLTSGTRVVLDMATLTITHATPMQEEVDQMRLIRTIELPLMNPELFLRVGVKPPGVNSTDVDSMLFGELHPPS